MQPQNNFLIGLWCAMKSGLYVTTDDDQLSGLTENKLQSPSQSQTCTRKRPWSLLGGLLPIRHTTAFSVQLLSCVQLFVTPWTSAHQASLSITNSWSLPKLMSIESVMPSNHLIAFWIPEKPLHLRNVLSKSVRCPENSNTCSQQQSTERAQQRPTTHCTTNTSKVKRTELWRFASATIFTWLLTSWLPLQASQPLCRENASTTGRRQKMFFKSLLNPKAQTFML